MAQSIEFLNADSRRAKFRQRRAEFQATATITALVYLVYAIHSYWMHGTDASGRNLNVNAEAMSVTEYLEALKSPQASEIYQTGDMQWQTSWSLAW